MRRLNLKRASSGFTLIELIITIVIIGVLAAVAIPKFQSLRGDAEQGVAAGIAASLASSTSVNYSRSKVPGAKICAATDAIGTGGCTYYQLASCADINAVKAFLADIPTGYTVNDLATAVPLNTAGVSTKSCTVSNSSITSDVFSVYGAV